MSTACRNKTIIWSSSDIAKLYELPFMELLHRAHTVHLEHFPENDIQLSTLLNIKTGGCPEDCHYCPQAQRYHTGVEAKKLMDIEDIKKQACSIKTCHDFIIND
jgi:biotin synthase